VGLMFFAKFSIPLSIRFYGLLYYLLIIPYQIQYAFYPLKLKLSKIKPPNIIVHHKYIVTAYHRTLLL
jgi:hypothetical protein